MGIVTSFYQKFCETHKSNFIGDCSYEFFNNGYKLSISFKFIALHAIYQKRAEMKKSYVFDYMVQDTNSTLKKSVEQKQAFPTNNLKSQLKFVNFVSTVISNFMSPKYDGESCYDQQ